MDNMGYKIQFAVVRSVRANLGTVYRSERLKEKSHNFIPNMTADTVDLLTCIPEVPGLNNSI
jgi:hypothetical protein